MQFVIALANLGVDRGIREFVRYGIFKRRGDNKVIMPLGRYRVRDAPKAHLLEDLDHILRSVDYFINRYKGQPPASLIVARNGIDNSILRVVTHGSTTAFKELLMAVGRLEKIIGRRDPRKEPKLARPLGGLSLDWLLACDDGSSEIRLAGAISSLYDRDIGTCRAHMVQVDPKRPYTWSEKKGNVSWGAGDIYRNLALSLHKRILLAAEQEGAHPLHSSIRLHPEDIMPILEGNVDQKVFEDLLWGMTWIDWSIKGRSQGTLWEVNKAWRKPLSQRVVPRGWSMLAATLSPGGMQGTKNERTVMRCDAGEISLLMADRYTEAVRTAHRRLYSGGVPVRMAIPCEELEGIKVAASLLVPTSFVKQKAIVALENERSE